MEIEYLEKMVTDCKLPVDLQTAQRMKVYTDHLLNAVTDGFNQTSVTLRAENGILKRAFKVQARMLDKARIDSKDISSENDKLKASLQKAQEENIQLANVLRQILDQQNNNRSSTGGMFRNNNDWDRDVAGF